MNLKRVSSIIAILFSSLTILYSCKDQNQMDKRHTALKNDVTSNTKTTLDPSATVFYQDKNNNLWLVSEEKGVYLHDGQNLTLFTTDDGLGSYRIISIQEDNLGNLYFDTPEGVFKYNGDLFTTLTITASNGAQNEWKSEPGDIWFRIGWDNRGPYRYDGENLYQLNFPKCTLEDEFYAAYPNASFNPYAIFSMYKDSKGNVWWGTSNMGIYLFDGQEISWMYETHLSKTPGGGDFGVRSIVEDLDHNYWICNANYKYSLLPNDSTIEGLKSINYTRQVGIENIEQENLYFYTIETDSKGNLFMFAQEDGLWLNDGKELTQFFIQVGDQNISPTSIYKDNQGLFWFNTDKHGIYTYNENTFEQCAIE